MELMSAQSVICGFWILQRADFFCFSTEEVLLCEAQSFKGNFVLRSENIFTFQVTANIGFWKEGGSFKSLKVTLDRYG